MNSSIRKYINLVEGEYLFNDPLGIVKRIRTIDEGLMHALGRENYQSPFHLSPCGRCRAPVWQQPCPVCNWYPMGGRDNNDDIANYAPKFEEYAQKWREVAPEKFKKLIIHYGNIAVWYLKNKIEKSAGATFKYSGEAIQPFLDETLTETWPNAEEIWQNYGARK